MITRMRVIAINIIGVAEVEKGEDETQRRIDSKMRKRMNKDNIQGRNKERNRYRNRQ